MKACDWLGMDTWTSIVTVQEGGASKAGPLFHVPSSISSISGAVACLEEFLQCWGQPTNSSWWRGKRYTEKQLLHELLYTKYQPPCPLVITTYHNDTGASMVFVICTTIVQEAGCDHRSNETVHRLTGCRSTRRDFSDGK